MFVTFAIAVIVGGLLTIRFFRKPGHWHPMDGQRPRNIDEIRRNYRARER